MYARVVVDLLEEVHFEEDVRQHCTVGPEYVPIPSVALGLDLPVEVLCDFAHDGVLSVYLALHSPETFMIIRLRLTFVCSSLTTVGGFFGLGLDMQRD